MHVQIRTQFLKPTNELNEHNILLMVEAKAYSDFECAHKWCLAKEKSLNSDCAFVFMDNILCLPKY